MLHFRLAVLRRSKFQRVKRGAHSWWRRGGPARKYARERDGLLYIYNMGSLPIVRESIGACRCQQESTKGGQLQSADVSSNAGGAEIERGGRCAKSNIYNMRVRVRRYP